MITLYDGTPGSGKSFHCIKDIVFSLTHGKNVIANFPVAVEKIQCDKKKMGKFLYVSNKNLTVKFLYDFAKKNHERGKEGLTKLVIDEAQTKFNPRDFKASDRAEFNQFFSLHRKLGYNVLLISQNDRLIDRQIRCNIEYRVKHRKVNNFGTIGMFIPFSVFAAIEYWYGINEKLGTNMIIFKKKLADLYDSYALFDDLTDAKSFNSDALEVVNAMKDRENENKVKVKNKKVNLSVKKIKILRFILRLKRKFKKT